MYKTISNEIIRKFNPCYDPSKYIKDENEELSVIQWIEKYRNVFPTNDIIWLLCRKEFLSEKDLRLFAVWCARAALEFVKNPDERSVEACNIAERYANGEATMDELLAARDAAAHATAAAYTVAYHVYYAAYYAANDDAHAAANAASNAAPYTLAYNVYYAANAAAHVAANAAAIDAANAAVYAARAADYASRATDHDDYSANTISNADYAVYAVDYSAVYTDDYVDSTAANAYDAVSALEIDKLLTYF
jgi:hypothetical protein